MDIGSLTQRERLNEVLDFKNKGEKFKPKAEVHFCFMVTFKIVN